MKIKHSVIAKQVLRFKALPLGQCDQEALNTRIEAIERYLLQVAKDEVHLRQIADRCILELKWVPVPADVAEIVSAIESERAPFWKSPPPLPARTAQDVLDDISFQKRFAIDRPKLAHHAEARLLELAVELEGMELLR